MPFGGNLLVLARIRSRTGRKLLRITSFQTKRLPTEDGAALPRSTSNRGPNFTKLYRRRRTRRSQFYTSPFWVLFSDAAVRLVRDGTDIHVPSGTREPFHSCGRDAANSTDFPTPGTTCLRGSGRACLTQHSSSCTCLSTNPSHPDPRPTPRGGYHGYPFPWRFQHWAGGPRRCGLRERRCLLGRFLLDGRGLRGRSRRGL